MNISFAKAYRDQDNTICWNYRPLETIGRAISKEKQHWDTGFVYCAIITIPGVDGQITIALCSNADHHHIKEHGRCRRQELPKPLVEGKMNETHLQSALDHIRGKDFQASVARSISATCPQVGKVITENMIKQLKSV